MRLNTGRCQNLGGGCLWRASQTQPPFLLRGGFEKLAAACAKRAEVCLFAPKTPWADRLRRGWWNSLGRQLLHALVKGAEDGLVLCADALCNVIRHVLVVGVRCSVAALDGFHPAFAVLNQALLERFADGVTRASDARVALVDEVVFHHVPGQFVGELEGLDEALLFQV